MEVTEAQLRFQVFNSLAFGVQGLIFWTYGLRHSDANDIFVSALINDEGTLTRAGEAVKKINKEVRCLSDIFLEANPVDRYTTGQPLENSSTGAALIPMLDNTDSNLFNVETTGGEGAIVTTFNSKEKRDPFKMRHYLMIASRDTENPQTATVRFKSDMGFGISLKAYQIIADLDNENSGFIRNEIRTDSELKFKLKAGNYLLFEYELI